MYFVSKISQYTLYNKGNQNASSISVQYSIDVDIKMKTTPSVLLYNWFG